MILTNRQEKMFDAYEKIESVLASCKTMEHIDSVMNMVKNFNVRFAVEGNSCETLTIALNRKIEKKRRQIIHKICNCESDSIDCMHCKHT